MESQQELMRSLQARKKLQIKCLDWVQKYQTRLLEDMVVNFIHLVIILLIYLKTMKGVYIKQDHCLIWQQLQ